MAGEPSGIPDSTAVRVALWRALHLWVDAAPPVLDDGIGLRLADPEEGWRRRPDMDPHATRGFRAAVVSRARFVDDLVTERAARGVGQYVILGAGLDTFAQRRPETAGRLWIFEIDQPDTQAWKRRRLAALGHGVPDRLRLVPVDFEAGDDWWARLVDAGFDPARLAVVACTGVTMYLTEEAVTATLRRLASLAPGSTLAMTFLLPLDRLDAADRPAMAATAPRARESGTPFRTFFTPERMLAAVRDAGFRDVRHVSGGDLADRYFTGRSDGLRPSSGEDFVVAGV